MSEPSVESKVWTYNGIEVFFDLDLEMVDLTSMWRACGSIETMHPRHWLTQNQTCRLIDSFCHILNVTEDYILNRQRGRNGGTWAAIGPALAYAHYLNTDFYARFIIEWIHYKTGGINSPESLRRIMTQVLEENRAKSEWRDEMAEAAKRFLVAMSDEPASFYEAPKIPIVVRNQPVIDPKFKGRVYVMRSQLQDRIVHKIGKTKRDVETRRKEIEGQSTSQVTTVKEIESDDMTLLEGKLLRFFKYCRVDEVKGDWHIITPGILERLLTLPDFVPAKTFDADEVLSPYLQPSLMG